EVKLASLTRWLLQHVRDALEQRLPILDVLQSDVRQPRDRRARFLHDALHIASRIGHDHAEPLVVLDLFHPDVAVRFGALHYAQVRLEQRVHEDDEYRAVDEGPREIDRPRGAIQRLLLDEFRLDVVVLNDVSLYRFFKMSGDDDQLVDVQIADRVHYVVHDGPA